MYYTFILCAGFLIALSPVPLSTLVLCISFILIVLFHLPVPMFFPLYSFLARVVYLSLSFPPLRSAFWHVAVLHFFMSLFIDLSPL